MASESCPVEERSNTGSREREIKEASFSFLIGQFLSPLSFSPGLGSPSWQHLSLAPSCSPCSPFSLFLGSFRSN